jgi:urocanate hydratase
MPINTHPPETFNFIAQVDRIYASLMQSASADSGPSLGGKLLYACELDEPGRILAIAGNIAGAATLAASANAITLRQAMRSGTIDFLVNSLDEALRILKNQIRKREPVSVAVSLAPAAIIEEMLDRGVFPDLLPPLQASATELDLATFTAQGAQRLPAAPSRPSRKFLLWQIPDEFAQRPADFDALLLGHLPSNDLIARRWLHQSPRYLGPQFRRLRSLRCDEETALKLIDVLGSPLET